MDFISKDEKSLYESLVYVESNPAATKKYGENARQRVIEYFSEEVLVDKVEQLYKSILDRKNN